MSGFVGSAGYLGEERAADSAATAGIGDGQGQDERLLAGMRLPAFVVSEIAVEMELGDPDNSSADLGHDDLHALGVVGPGDGEASRIQDFFHHRVVDLGDVADQGHGLSIAGPSARNIARADSLCLTEPTGKTGRGGSARTRRRSLEDRLPDRSRWRCNQRPLRAFAR